MAKILSVRTAVAMCLSAIIGDTLFAVTGIPIAQAGPNAIWAYIIVGIIAALVGMVFGELASLMPNEKGLSYSYVRRALGSEPAFITGMLLYLAYCTTVSAVSFSFGGYALSLLGMKGVGLQIAIAACLIIFISYLNMRGLKETARLSEILIVITILTAVLFIGFAIYHSGLSLNFATNQSQQGLGPFGAAVTTVVFAYAGFQTIATVTEHVKGQGKGIAKAIAYSIVISAIAYIGITFGLMLLIPPSHTTINPQPLYYALLAANAPSYVSTLVLIGTMVAIAASIITIVMVSSRLFHQMSADGMLPKAMRKYDETKEVAIYGIIVSAVIEIIVLLSGDIYTMISISNFGIILSWVMAGIVLLNMRRRKQIGSFAMPLHPYTTLIAIGASLFFLFGLPIQTLEIGAVLVIILLASFYSVAVLERRKIQKVRLFD